MTFRNWRYDEERLQEIVEKSPAALEAFNKALRSTPQMAGLKEPIETAVEGMRDMAKDLMAAREYLKDADTENDRLRIRIRELEDMIIQRSIPGNTYPAPGDRGPDPTRGFPARFSEGGPMEPTAAAGTQAGPSPAPGSLS